MNTEDVLKYIEMLANKAEGLDSDSPEIFGLAARAREFLRVHVGEESEFYNSIFFLDDKKPDGKAFANILRNFQEYIRDGFSTDFTPLQEAEQNVVSDFLNQARLLLEDKKVHPAAACVLIGATLEEFLRNWAEGESLKLGNRKPSISNYAALLTSKGLINKQDNKDILSWGGLRNDAAHGKWDEINNRERAKLMLEGVNLFLRKYGNI
ncbi:MAG: hypothetical protein PVH61_44225 [Candidatus Aminicenantes bacterium]